MPPTKHGPYVVGRQISARTGNADVFEAEHETTGEVVALKLLRARRSTTERYLRFRDEVAFHETNSDPGVLPMVDAYAPPDLPPGATAWMAMPLAIRLEDALAGAGLAKIVDAIAGIAETLARLADKGIHHRDIKPQNLFMLADVPVVGDFGLVTYPNKPEVTDDTRHVGPIYYIAPEMVVSPDMAAPGPADVFSLAKTLWVLATGYPRPTPGPLDVPHLALRSLLTDPRSYLLDPVLEFSTSSEPTKRPTMSNFASELRGWLAEPAAVPVSDEDILADATRRLASLVAPGLRDAQARLDRMRTANSAHDRLKEVLYPVKAALDKAVPLIDSYAGYTQLFNLFPQLTVPDSEYVIGWASIRNSPNPRISLIAWVGVQLRAAGVLHLAAAYALEPYAGTGRELIWSEVRDVIPSGPGEVEAIRALGNGLAAHMSRAVATFADRLQGTVGPELSE